MIITTTKIVMSIIMMIMMMMMIMMIMIMTIIVIVNNNDNITITITPLLFHLLFQIVIITSMNAIRLSDIFYHSILFYVYQCTYAIIGRRCWGYHSCVLSGGRALRRMGRPWI